MTVGRRPSIPREVFDNRLIEAFKGSAIENGCVPSLDDALIYDIQQGNTPPMQRATAFRRIKELTKENPEVDIIGTSAAFAGQIGIRNAVIVDDVFYVHGQQIS
jgi:hypothetical protein